MTITRSKIQTFRCSIDWWKQPIAFKFRQSWSPCWWIQVLKKSKKSSFIMCISYVTIWISMIWRIPRFVMFTDSERIWKSSNSVMSMKIEKWKSWFKISISSCGITNLPNWTTGILLISSLKNLIYLFKKIPWYTLRCFKK